MASNSLTLYYDSATTRTFKLVSSGSSGAEYQVEGRDLATPYSITTTRKKTAPNAAGNDHIQVRVARTERNTSTQKLATMQVLLDISIPKDTSVITIAEQKKLLGECCSLLRDATANAATQANVTALIGGFDL